MKDFGQYLKEEIDLEGNRGVPDDFMRNTDREAAREVGFNRKDTPPYPGSETQRTIQELMPLLDQSQQMMHAGNREESETRLTSLEELAEDVIMDLYGDILDDVILDLKLVRPGDVAREVEGMSEVPQAPPRMRQGWIDDLELAKKIDKQKLINNVVQGEGLNTKNILHGEQVKVGLRDIFAHQADRIFDIWDRTTKLAQKMDWLIPVEAKADMLANQPQGMAGAVLVTWEEKEEKEDEDYQEPEAQDDDFEQEDAEITPTEYDPSEDESEFDNYVPKIKVRAVDFPMLLHEAVKGIYELIGSISVPDAETATEEEVEDAEVVKLNTSSMTDEAEDFRYGPFIAAKLRDAVNECDGADDYPNTREHVFGRLCAMDATRFLEIMKKILDTNENAKDELEIIIREINGMIEEEERDYQLGQIDNGADDDVDYGQNDDEDYDDDGDLAGDHDGQENELDQLIARTARGDEEPQEEQDEYSKMSDVELQRAIDVALDNNNMDLVRKIGSYLGKNEAIDVLIHKLKNYMKS